MPSYRSIPEPGVGPGVGPGPGMTGPQDLLDPPFVDAEDRQRGGHVVVDPGPCREMEVVVAQQADRDEVDAQRPLRLIDDHAEQFLSIVRGGQLPGDAEDAVEALGELGLEADAQPREVSLAPCRPEADAETQPASGGGNPVRGANQQQRGVAHARSSSRWSHRAVRARPSPAVPGTVGGGPRSFALAAQARPCREVARSGRDVARHDRVVAVADTFSTKEHAPDPQAADSAPWANCARSFMRIQSVPATSHIAKPLGVDVPPEATAAERLRSSVFGRLMRASTLPIWSLTRSG